MSQPQATTLRHNPLNAVTETVERLTYADGRTAIRKRLRRPVEASGDPWGASQDPRHWNYWRREVEVYRDEALREQLATAGLVLPDAEVVEADSGAVLMLEDVTGLAGTDFGLAEHAALARACGRWQARAAGERDSTSRAAGEREWTSRGFLREYSTTREVPWELVDEDDAWRQPLIAETWPVGLRKAWRELLANRGKLLNLVESSPRTHCHLDLWVSNVIQRPTGEFALLDWAFTGDGALGEDIGNHIPDAVFDLFWPAERQAELADTCITGYLAGLDEAGRRGDSDDVRRAVLASGVKYAWLLPHLLGRAGLESHQAYHQEADSRHLYHQRGQALAFVAEWCAEALR
ncbi:aminoglycoside phosphotransferase family protein [Kribbella sp. NPDC056345]|uniref:aminoglycoside phosphotransferase family protein n=1 Tax=Kribbella sp. NPDC056345 TaxID=3345789 RepID=UPI0035D8D3D4